jgi:hypothetical protein
VTSLKLLFEKHVITKAEYDSALRDIAATSGAKAATQRSRARRGRARCRLAACSRVCDVRSVSRSRLPSLSRRTTVDVRRGRPLGADATLELRPPVEVPTLPRLPPVDRTDEADVIEVLDAAAAEDRLR